MLEGLKKRMYRYSLQFPMFSLPYRGLVALLLLVALVGVSHYLIHLGTTYATFEKLSASLLRSAASSTSDSRTNLPNVIVSRILLNSSLVLPRNGRPLYSVLNDSDDHFPGTLTNDEPLQTIYMITPTYRRAEQIPELTRTCQTLKLVANLVWIVVEDAPKTTPEVVHYLQKCGVPFVYMRAEMPTKFQKLKNKPRGVANRNAGIEYVRRNAKDSGGVVYFGDDDNTYDVQIFEEMRHTREVSMFPVGLVTSYALSTPIVRDGVVIDFYDGWIANRTFPVDMAGFAINLKLLLKYPKCTMPFHVGYEEDGLLKCLKVTLEQIQPLANNCTEILVWHTQTKKTKPAKYNNKKMKMERTNLLKLKTKLWKGS